MADISALQTWISAFDKEYYWSWDENGETSISEHTQRTLDLPILIPRLIVRKYGWRGEAYENVYKYQKARGFDPRTTQFAGSLGLYELESLVQEGKVQVGNEQFEDNHGSSFPTWTSWWKTKRKFFDMW
ncbi:hypothetical protein VNI00_009012 [Paramarasmius palmivorus]|uniref:Uncharacterized protein n=1 Tax=Paramarasmius palmivorus TaxID=297713 RepID=A0AAW0CS25_9AGAR